MDLKVLVLAPWMAPLHVRGWQAAISDVFLGKSDVLEEYDATVSSPSITIGIPAVVRLRKHLARTKKDVRFSRSGVYTRDGHRCQYCGKKKPARDLTYDHVIPRSRGGPTTWENIATACRACNGRKDRQTPEEAGMRLLTKPVRPASLPIATLFVVPREVPALWLPYLEGHALAETG